LLFFRYTQAGIVTFPVYLPYFSAQRCMIEIIFMPVYLCQNLKQYLIFVGLSVCSHKKDARNF
jgi:hypothetical protein